MLNLTIDIILKMTPVDEEIGDPDNDDDLLDAYLDSLSEREREDSLSTESRE